jgi:hypothetical protein
LGDLFEQKRWQIVTYLKSLKQSPSARTNGAAPVDLKPVKTNAPPPPAPFTDFRFEEPENFRKITVQDLPAPYVTDSAANGPQLVARPRDAWPKAPAGFKVQQYATGLDNPRLIRTAPTATFSWPKAAAEKSEYSVESLLVANQNTLNFSRRVSTNPMASRSTLPATILNGST